MRNNDLRHSSGSNRKQTPESDENLWNELFGGIMSYADFLKQKEKGQNGKIVLLEGEFQKWKGGRNKPGVEDVELRRGGNEGLREYFIAKAKKLLEIGAAQ